MHNLNSLSPLDGRYADKVAPLADYFSEMALMKYRILIEVEYFIALSLEKKIKEFPALSAPVQKKLRGLYKNFSLTNGQRIKDIEKTTQHDVKAVEYFLKEKIINWPCKKYSEFIHFALTSEDVNNLAYSLMWKQSLEQVYIPVLKQVMNKMSVFAVDYTQTPLLALTHGQSATPTTVGKEFFVFIGRLFRQFGQLHQQHLNGKLNGATGGWSAHVISYPEVNWLKFSNKFISSLGLEPHLLTTQIESHDSLAESFHIVERINTILIDFTRDVWLYIMRGVLGQTKKVGEVGSSTMPHKINPIRFDNAEGNLGIANALFSHLAEKLPISRLQRDLTDSTVLRNLGVPLGHSLLACQNILTGMSRLTVNEEKLNEELDTHWEVLAEAIQVILRKVGYPKPYEKLKELTRGEKITQETIHDFVEKLDIPKQEKSVLLKLTPQKYTGLASTLKSKLKLRMNK